MEFPWCGDVAFLWYCIQYYLIVPSDIFLARGDEFWLVSGIQEVIQAVSLANWQWDGHKVFKKIAKIKLLNIFTFFYEDAKIELILLLFVKSHLNEVNTCK